MEADLVIGKEKTLEEVLVDIEIIDDIQPVLGDPNLDKDSLYALKEELKSTVESLKNKLEALIQEGKSREFRNKDQDEKAYLKPLKKEVRDKISKVKGQLHLATCHRVKK